MDMTAPPAPADPGKYLVEQTPTYVASLIALRDELAKRQGSLSAVEKTAKLQRDAEHALEVARDAADKLLVEAQERLAQAKKKEAELKDKGRQLDMDRTAFEDAQAKAAQALEIGHKANAEKAEELAALEVKLAMRAAELDTIQLGLDQKVRDLQAKVAALAL